MAYKSTAAKSGLKLIPTLTLLGAMLLFFVSCKPSPPVSGLSTGETDLPESGGRSYAATASPAVTGSDSQPGTASPADIPNESVNNSEAPAVTESPPENSDNPIYITLNSVSRTDISCDIHNDSGYELSCGEYYCVQEYKDGEWSSLPDVGEAIWPDIAYGILPHSVFDSGTNLERRYGVLPDGKYRFVKDIYIYNPEAAVPLTLYQEFSLPAE